MNLVEGFFSALTADRVRGCSFTSVTSVKDLTATITAHIKHFNWNPRPYE